MADVSEQYGNHGKEFDFHQPKLNEVARKFLEDLEEEKRRLSEAFPLCKILVEEAFDRIYCTGRIPGKEFYADVYKQKPIKLTQKVFVPIKQYPTFNFTGKILGPKGNSLRRLQEETQCKILVKGRNSMRDRKKEEEFRNTDEPRYAHLHKDLFLEISTVAPPAESYARVAYALAEIRKYLVPDKNDEVSQEQLQELMEIDPQAAKKVKSSLPQRYLLDKKLGAAPSLQKYRSILKETSYSSVEEEIDEECYEYPKSLKRTSPPGYEYAKLEKPSPDGTYKRSPIEVKRLREAPKPYSKPSYAIVKKYK